MNTLVEVSDLVKRYHKAKTNAVDGISFTVQEGDFYTFLGPNGAGKTTTISILSTILSKTSGHVKIAGYDIEQNSKEIRKLIGIIFQNPSLDKNLSAEENIRFHAILYGQYPFRPAFRLMPRDYQNKVMELAEILGLQNSITKPVKTFSGGMKRKLEILRSLIHTPRILFLDEPTTGLDPESRKQLWQYLNEVRKKRLITIFLTTHYLEEAEGADQVCIINKGKIVANGTTEQIRKNLVDHYMTVSTSKSKEKSLLQDLIKRKLKFTNTPTGFKIRIKPHAIHILLRSINIPLNNIFIHNPTLEEAYLNIIAENNE